MIALLARRHLVTPAIVPFVIGSATMLLVLPGEIAPLPLLLFALLAWRLVPQGVDAFEASLPLRGREVIMARALVAIACALLPATTWVVVTLVRGGHGVLALRPEPVLLCVLAVLAPHVLARGAVGGGIMTSPIVAWAGLAALSTPVWLVAPKLAVPALALGVVAAFVFIWTTVPDALTLCPSRTRAKVPHSARAGAGPSSRSGRQSVLRSGHRALSRSILSWHVIMFWLIVLGMSLLSSDSAGVYFFYSLLAIPATVRTRTRWLAALPVSHRARLLAIVVPALVVPAGCVAIGAAFDGPFPSATRSLTRDAPRSLDGDYLNRTTVSIDQWRRAPAGTAPVIRAPWGEHLTADTATVFGITLFNPWTTSRTSTPRFVEWQFERATTAAYGRPLTIEEYAALRPPPRRLAGGIRAWLATGSFLLTFGLVVLLVMELGYSGRKRPGSPAAVGQWVAALLLIALMVVDTAYRVRGGDVVHVLLHRWLFELGKHLPSNVALAVVVAAIPVAAAYALLERQFRQSEPALTTGQARGRRPD